MSQGGSKPTGDEIVVIVDRDNNLVGSATRAEMRSEGLIHRASYILVFNTKGDLFVQKRTLAKDIYPGYYDVTTGGVVQAGESYEETAKREIHEELGITGVPLKTLFDFYHEDSGNHVWGRAYMCVYDGEIKLQEEEVESGGFHSVHEALKWAEDKPFTPDGMHVLSEILPSLGEPWKKNMTL